jgi:YgiT-type zinc finger domain-containing protein
LAEKLYPKEIMMKCILCKAGETSLGKVTVPLQRGETTILIKGVPTEICNNCGEYYLSESVTGQVLDLGEEAVKKGVEVEILRFAA